MILVQLTIAMVFLLIGFVIGYACHKAEGECGRRVMKPAADYVKAGVNRNREKGAILPYYFNYDDALWLAETIIRDARRDMENCGALVEVGQRGTITEEERDGKEEQTDHNEGSQLLNQRHDANDDSKV